MDGVSLCLDVVFAWHCGSWVLGHSMFLTWSMWVVEGA